MQLQGDVRIFAEGSGEDIRYYAQTGADAASKKQLGSGMYKCPDRWHIASKTVGYSRNNPMFILTFRKNDDADHSMVLAPRDTHARCCLVL